MRWPSNRWVEAEIRRALVLEHLARGTSFTGSTALQMLITEITGSTQVITVVSAPCSYKPSQTTRRTFLCQQSKCRPIGLVRARTLTDCAHGRRGYVIGSSLHQFARCAASERVCCPHQQHQLVETLHQQRCQTSTPMPSCVALS